MKKKKAGREFKKTRFFSDSAPFFVIPKIPFVADAALAFLLAAIAPPVASVPALPLIVVKSALPRRAMAPSQCNSLATGTIAPCVVADKKATRYQRLRRPTNQRKGGGWPITGLTTTSRTRSTSEVVSSPGRTKDGDKWRRTA
ncbi:hypothetical protein OPV22_021987 [Ensete ventricosum]|uniref:Uncharacterized protein n=1 Tax=Ensete ventricosum TaxID=4639 RepID=A0AAV8QK77_ENSVE|nr:hypothetical protein OPV22_021987 [Ensete ventricosum]